MRFILMQLFGWSPTTFHSVWNAENCEMYVLQKDLSKPGPSPYVLDNHTKKLGGSMPRSSIDVLVTLKQTAKQMPSPTQPTSSSEHDKEQCNSTKELILRLEDYLSIPPPRTTRIELVKHMLYAQYPNQIKDPNDIGRILFMPFVKGGVLRGRSTSGVLLDSNQKQSSSLSDTTSTEESDDRLSNCNGNNNNNKNNIPFKSHHRPCVVAASIHTHTTSSDDQLHDDHVGNSMGDTIMAETTTTIRPTAQQERSFRYPCIDLPGMLKPLE